jgi:hypothetical protein
MIWDCIGKAGSYSVYKNDKDDKIVIEIDGQYLIPVPENLQEEVNELLKNIKEGKEHD